MDIYQDMPEGYYLKAMLNGYSVQRFWHKYKLAQISACIPDDPKITIIDVGCGAGNLFFQHKKSAKRKIGMDIASKQINYAKKIMPDANWVCADVAKCNLPKADYIVVSEVIEHLFPCAPLIKRIRKALNSGGTLVLTTPNYSSFWPVLEKLWGLISPVKYKEQHINKFTFNRLRKFAESEGFKIKTMKTIFLLTPFIALISEKLAYKIAPLEQKLIGNFGLILFAVLEKKRN